jgi:hypothetical protein
LTDADTPAQDLWRRSADLAVVDHGDRVVVLALSQPATARPLVMEGPAAAIWHALDEPGTTAQVAARVAADFGFPAAEVRRDVETFLALLAARSLVLMERVPRSDLDADGARDA